MTYKECVSGSGAGNVHALIRVHLHLYVLALVLYSPMIAAAQTSILTQHYDNARTGQNTNETILTTQNVNSTTFGKLFSLRVDGYVYAQPLYVPRLATSVRGTHNVLYVATENDSIYAFDADSGAQLWKTSFLINGATTVTSGCPDLPVVGVTATPVIDPLTHTLYAVSETEESGSPVHRLHALDITTGKEKFGGPVIIKASVQGSGFGSKITFNDQSTHNRPGLLLDNGYVYIGFGSLCDQGPWRGWVLAYNASTLLQSGAWVTTPNGEQGGIWNAGGGIAADASGNAYVVTGNGDYPWLSGLPLGQHAPQPSPAVDFGDSVVRLSLANGKPLPKDYFVPYNQELMFTQNLDLGAGGVILLPDQPGPYPHILITGGKLGLLYLLNRDQLTSDNSYYCNGCSGDPEIIQTVTVSGPAGGIFSTPTYWNGGVYIWAQSDSLKLYPLINGQLGPLSSRSLETMAFPGSTTVISSNGTTNGIVWSVDYFGGGPAILRAYDATNVANLLYGSNLTQERDTLGAGVKFVVPVVTNGKVYVGTQTEVDVFGLLGGRHRGPVDLSRQSKSTRAD